MNDPVTFANFFDGHGSTLYDWFRSNEGKNPGDDAYHRELFRCVLAKTWLEGQHSKINEISGKLLGDDDEHHRVC